MTLRSGAPPFVSSGDSTLERYGIGDAVLMEEHMEPTTPKLSWEETAREMAARQEDWSEWDATLADGLEQISWAPAPRARRKR